MFLDAPTLFFVEVVVMASVADRGLSKATCLGPNREEDGCLPAAKALLSDRTAMVEGAR